MLHRSIRPLAKPPAATPDAIDSAAIVARLNAHPPAVIRTLEGRVVAYALERQQLRMAFRIGPQFCHSVDIVQGGFVAAMLDAAMAHVLLASVPGRVRIASIDLQVSYLRAARAGQFTAVASIVKAGGTVAFVRAELFAPGDELVATATCAAHLRREPGSAASGG
jgi:uncharacterized protein (TIGR00369 family)